MAEREEIVREAMSLSPEDRLYVADVLEQSLSGGEFRTPEISAAWAVEIQKRIDAYDRGEVAAIPLDASLERIRQFLAVRAKRP
jgi:putative addiction module component (TIGR02574 family)